MHKQIQAIITLLSLINPAISAVMCVWTVAGQSRPILNRKEVS